MAKKSRRVKQEGQKITLSPAQMVRPKADETGEAVVVSAAAPVAQTTNLREEYRYVIADLKRIGVIALVMLAVLIVLALLLT